MYVCVCQQRGEECSIRPDSGGENEQLDDTGSHQSSIVITRVDFVKFFMSLSSGAAVALGGEAINVTLVDVSGRGKY